MNNFFYCLRLSMASLLVLISFPGRAQSSSLFFNTNFQAVHSPSFETFADEYNSFMGTNLTKKLDPVRTGTGWGIGWNVASEEGLMIGMEYNTVRSKTSAEFNDGAIRDFKLKDGGFRFIGGYSMKGVSDNYYFYPFMGFTVGKNRLESTYTPGSNNFTGEMLNGNYSELTLKYNLGFRAAFGTEKIKLLLGLEYVGKFIPIDLVDEEKSSSSPFTSSIGTDYDVFANSPELYLGKYIETDFRGLRFSVGVSFDFGM